MFRKALSSLLFLIGFICIVGSGVFFMERYSPSTLSFATAPSSIASGKIQVPVRLQIDEINISLPVFQSEVKNNKWETTVKGVSYLVTSTAPGEVGNAVFYGHNFPHLLGKLDDVSEGSVIHVTESDGTEDVFKVTEKKVVQPTDVWILSPTKDRRITIYTCTGFLDSKRLVVIGKLIKQTRSLSDVPQVSQ